MVFEFATFRTRLIGLKEMIDVVAMLSEVLMIMETSKSSEPRSLAAIVMWL